MPYLHTSYPESGHGLRLTTAESLILMTVRLWLHEKNNQSHMCTWADGLRAGGMGQDCIHSLNRLLQLLHTHASRQLQVNYPECGCISNDEGLFLELIGLLQLRQCETVRVILGYWLTPQLVRMAFHPARQFARSLVAEDMLIPLRDSHGSTGMVPILFENQGTKSSIH